MISLTGVLVSVLLALVSLYVWCRNHYSYWRRKNVAHVEPNLIFGNFKGMFTMTACAADQLIDLYNHPNAKDQPIVGMHIFSKPALLLRDLELIKSVLVKNFNKFSNRYSSCDPHGDPLGANSAFFIKNPYWKELRTKLTPVFTSAKMKQMFPLVEESGRELDSFLCNLPMDAETNSCIEELKEITAHFSTDAISTVAFGVQANSLKNPNSDFRTNGRHFSEFTLWRAIELLVIFFTPHFLKLLRCKLFPRNTSQFFRDTFNFVMSERIRLGTTRNDLIDILVDFEKAAVADSSKKHIHKDFLVAQAAVFFTASHDTISSVIAFGLYELAKQPELQSRLREEIREALLKNAGDGEVTYEMLKDMEYLGMVVQEVLRMYPPLPFLDRQCTLAEGEKAFSLQPFSDFAVPDGMPVYIPTYALHRDPKYFPNPNEFDPERFSPMNISNVKPFTYIPFGGGPHNCIGKRLGHIQAKVGLLNFLRNHRVATCEQSHQDMVLDPKAVFVTSKGGIFCRVVRDPLI